MSRIILILVLLVVTPVPGVADTPLPAPEARAAIEAYLAPFVEREDLSGNLLVARGEEVLYERSFGWANRELKVPVTPERRFNVASITKPMTVIALIHLVVEGKLTMADPLSKWIPDFPRGEEITVGHLVRHRAGIPHRITESHEETVPRTAADMVEFARRKPLTSEPGETHTYSSGGFAVLSRVLELASGLDYNTLLQRTVFDPVGMPHSAHVDGRMILEGRASGYMRGPGGTTVNARYQDLSFLVGGGSVYSTARDLYAMVGAVRSGQLGPGPQGAFVDDNGLDWNGVTNAFRAFADWHRASDVTVVFVGNLQTGAANRIRRDLYRVVAGEVVATPEIPDIEPVALPTETLRGWEGIYQLGPGNDLRVTARDGALFANDWVLIPVGARRFWSPQDYAFVSVVLDESGNPTRLDWEVQGETFPCPRTGDLDS